MRDSKTFEISKNRKVTVNEFRFPEVRFIAKRVLQNDTLNISIEEILTLLLHEFNCKGDSVVILPKGKAFGGINEKDRLIIYEKIVEVNPSFFEVKKDGKPGKSGKTSSIKELDRAAFVMIERGHTHVFDYGWEFFKTCRDFILEKAEN